jgi:uncharacterized membrane protein YczE
MFFDGETMRKASFYSEIAYVVGIVSLALGSAFMEKADLGMSMVVAPAYLLYLKFSQLYPFVTFGMAEYTIQGCLLVVMVLVLRRFKVSYLFSFITAIIYGFTLDGCIALIACMDASVFALRVIYYVIGLLLCAIGVAFIFHTYIAPEVYELFVKAVSAKTHIKISRFKTVYDCVSCLAGIIMSFLFFGLFHFRGVQIGTVICALVNGKTIGIISNFMEKHFEFVDILPLRKYF